VHEEAVVDMNEGVNGVDVRDQAARGLRLADRNDVLESQVAEDRAGIVTDGRMCGSGGLGGERRITPGSVNSSVYRDYALCGALGSEHSGVFRACSDRCSEWTL
jgi:hypothetical protein